MQFLSSSLKQLPAQSKRFFRVASVAAVLAMVSQSAIALPDEIEMDRYLLAAGSYLEENRLDQVADYLEKIESLSVKPPALYHYYKARVLKSKGDKTEERKALEDYVSAAGKDGKHYEQSLRRITALEEGLEKPASKEKVSAEALISASGNKQKQASDRYAKRLKALYLKKTFNEALVEHINTLLATHEYSGKRLQSNKDNPILSYSVSIADDSSILVVEKDGRETPERITTDKTNVYGQNTFLKHECDYAKAACVVKKPDLYTQWLKIGYDENAAKEITLALSHLLQNLQQGKK